MPHSLSISKADTMQKVYEMKQYFSLFLKRIFILAANKTHHCLAVQPSLQEISFFP